MIILFCVQVLTGTSHSQGIPPNVPAAFKNFSISQKEKTLDELVQDQWLSSTPDGKIRLGVRSFLDLRSWFHNNDVPSCDVCNEAGVKVFFLILFHADQKLPHLFNVSFVHDEVIFEVMRPYRIYLHVNDLCNLLSGRLLCITLDSSQDPKQYNRYNLIKLLGQRELLYGSISQIA